ncbi:MAG: hypothetical protein ACREAX_03270 [Candidatus Nitrosotenuis sp.]
MKRRGIAPAITTMLLIGVAVIGGISAGTTMSKQNEIISKTTKIDVIRANLIDIDMTNKTFFTMNLKNTGTTTILSGNMGFYNNDVFHSIDIPKLDPGETFGTSQIFDTDVSLNHKYAINARVLATDGSTYEWSDTQTAISG